MAEKAVSIIGCGWLALPLARRLIHAGHRVKGSTTSAEKLTVLRQAGIEPYLLQLKPEPIGDLQTLLEADILIIDIPPKAGKMGDDFHPQQIQHVTRALKGSSVKNVIYVSSTSVYPELTQPVVPVFTVEESVSTEAESAAPALVRAEQMVQQLSPGQVTTILRCGGLMGYDRIPGKYVAGKRVDTGAVPVNYIHRDDAVSILQLLIEQQVAGTFNAVSPEHPTRERIYRKSCADFGYELPLFTESTADVPYKVISPDKLLNVTNYAFKYPNPLDFNYGLETS